MKPLDQKFIVIIPVVITITTVEVTYFLYRMWSDALLAAPINEDNVRLCALMSILLFILFSGVTYDYLAWRKKMLTSKR